MATTQKALSLALTLQSKLLARLGSVVHDVSFDSDQNPLILIDDGTPAAGESAAVIKIQPEPWPLARDVLGNAAIQYTPHVVKLCTEKDPTGGAGADIMALQTKLSILAECLALGCKTEWYRTTNGTVPSASALATLDDSAPEAAVYPDLYNPMTSQQ